jgi:small subunit ribosomal protein S7
MPRGNYKKNIAKQDPIYSSLEVSKLINYVMEDGKKSVASKIVYEVLDMIAKEKQDPMSVLRRTIENVAPTHEVKPKRVGGASYLVPQETRSSRRVFLALNWIINAAKARSSKEYRSMAEKLHAEIMDAYKELGEAMNKKKNVEKLAEANKAFAHFKW